MSSASAYRTDPASSTPRSEPRSTLSMMPPRPPSRSMSRSSLRLPPRAPDDPRRLRLVRGVRLRPCLRGVDLRGRDHPPGDGLDVSKRLPAPPPKEAPSDVARLLRMPCGVVTRAYGLRTVCRFAVGHFGRHQGASR